MASCSGDKAHGDTNELLREETGLSAHNMDIIIQQIFTECDKNNFGCISVSVLIKFVAKYFNDCLTDWRILELKRDLDPENIDKLIDIKTLTSVWPTWVLKVEKSSSNGIQEVPPLEFDSLAEPKRNLPSFIHKTDLNLSTTSMITIQETPNVLADRVVYEDKIKELIHHNHYLLDEVSVLKTHLLNSEEQVDSLQKDFEILKKKSNTDHVKLKELQNIQSEYERLRDAPDSSIRTLDKLQKQISSLKKENGTLSLKLDNLELEKKTADEEVEKMCNKLKGAIEDFVKLESDLQGKEENIAQLENQIANLRNALEEKERDLEYFQNESEKYKTEKQALEKHIVAKKERTNPNPNAHKSNNQKPQQTGIGDESASLQETSSEQDLFWKVQLHNNSHSPHESLLDEISQAFIKDNENSNFGPVESNSFKLNCDNSCTYVINKHKKEISKLETELMEIQQQNKSLEDVVNQRQVQVTNLKVELSVQNDKSSIVTTENADLRNKIEELNCIISELRDENAQKYIKIENLRQTVEKLQLELQKDTNAQTEEISKLKSTLIELKTEQSNYEKTIENLTKKLEDLNEENSKLQIGVNVTNELCTELEFVKNELNCREEHLKERQDDYEREMKKWIENYEDASNRYEDVKKKLDTSKETHLNQIKTLELKVNNLKAKLEEKEGKLLDVICDANMHKESNNSLRVESKKLLKNLKDLESEIEEKNKKLQALENKDSNYSKETDTLKSEIENLNAEKVKLLEQCKKLDDNLHNITSELNIVKNNYEQLVVEKGNAVQRFENLKLELNTFVNTSESDKRLQVELKNQQVILGSELNDLKQALGRIFKLKDDYLNEVLKEKDEITAENTVLLEKIELMQEDNIAKNKLIEELNKNLTDNFDDIEERELKSNLKDQMLHEQYEKLLEVQQQLAYLNHVNQSLLQENEDLKEKCEQWSDSVSDRVGCANCNVLKEKISELEAHLNIGDEKQMGRSNFCKLETINNKLKVRVELLEEQLKFEESQVKQLKNQLECSISDEMMARLRQEYSELQGKYLQGKEEVEGLRNENVALKENMDSTCSELRKENQIIRKTIESLKEELCEQLLELNRSTLYFVDTWRKSLEKIPNFHELLTDIDSHRCGDVSNAIDEKFNQITLQTRRTGQLLNALASVRRIPSGVEQGLCVFCSKIIEIQSSSRELQPVFASSISLEPFTPIDANENVKHKMSVGCQTEVLHSSDTDEDTEADIVVTQASPSFSDDFLQKLRLEENRGPNISEKEMEDKFVQLVLAFMVDKSTLKERLAKMEDHSETLQNRLAAVTAKAYKLLETIKGSQSCREEQLLDIKIQIESVLDLVSQISISAELLGALRHEKKLLMSINVIIRQWTLIKKNIKKATQLFPSTDYNSSNQTVGNVWYDNAVILNNTNGFTSITDYALAKRFSMCPNFKTKKKDKTPHLRSKRSLLCPFYISVFIFTVLTFYTVITIVLEMELTMHGVKPPYRIPLENWLVPWVKKSYPYGPPPT